MMEEEEKKTPGKEVPDGELVTDKSVGFDDVDAGFGVSVSVN